MASTAAFRKVVIVVGYLGGIFDVDGVLVDSPHERAWRESLQGLMEHEWRGISAQTSYMPERFTPEIYQEVMAGMPRMSGARAALEHFGVPDAARRAEEYAARKQVRVVELIEAGELHGLPRRTAVSARGQGRGDPRRLGVVIEEREALPPPDPAGYLRRGAGSDL